MVYFVPGTEKFPNTERALHSERVRRLHGQSLLQPRVTILPIGPQGTIIVLKLLVSQHRSGCSIEHRWDALWGVGKRVNGCDRWCGECPRTVLSDSREHRVGDTREGHVETKVSREADGQEGMAYWGWRERREVLWGTLCCEAKPSTPTRVH